MPKTVDMEGIWRRWQALDEEQKRFFFPHIWGRMESEIEMTGEGAVFFEKVEDILDDLEEEKMAERAKRKKAV